MLATGVIFAVALGLSVATGVVAESLLSPSDGFRLRARTPAVGFSILVVLLVALGSVLPVRLSAWVMLTLVLLAAVVSTCAVRQAQRHSTIRPSAWTASDRQGLVLAAAAVTAALFVLSPVLRLGFPTTIAAMNNDGWSYAGMANWLISHAWPAPQDLQYPFDTFGVVIAAQLRDGFGIGFESFASSIAVITGYPSYAVVQPVAALAVVVAAAGWFTLGQQLLPRMDTGRLACLTLPAIAPAAVVIYSENYLPHAFGIALIPVALGALIGWFTTPSLSTLVRSGFATAAVLCVYPGIAPWLAGPWLLISVYIAGREALAPARGAPRRPWRLAGLLGAPLLVMFTLAPYQAIQTLTFLSQKVSGAAVPYPDMGRASASAFVLGATGPGSIVGPPSPAAVVATLLLGTAAVLGLGLLLGSWRRNPLSAISAVGVGAVCVFALIRFASLDDFAYGVFKVLANSGALLAGFAMLGLLAGSMRWRPLPLLSLVGLVGATWLIASASVLEAAHDGSAGFRAPDVTAARALAELPAGAVILVEGTSDSGEVFHRRMALAYFDKQNADDAVVGLGTTSSYMPLTGTYVWRPATPWNYVIGDSSEELTPGRQATWSNGAYTLWSAPPVDSTPYGTGWYPIERAADGGRFRWTSGAVEFLVSNRRPTATRIRVSLRLTAWERPRVAVLRQGRRILARTLTATRGLSRLVVNTTVAPAAVTVLTLDAGRGGRGPAGDPRVLSLRVAHARITPVPPRTPAP